MMAIDLGVRRVDQALRLVRALGAHRYVAGRLHLAHAFAVAAVADDAAGVLAAARDWALGTLENAGSGLDLGSRDERLWRRCSDAELAAVLDAYWTPGPRAHTTRAALRALLDRHGLTVSPHEAFDESVEDAIHPLTVDAGWELLTLRELDAERHKGAIASFGDDLGVRIGALRGGDGDSFAPPSLRAARDGRDRAARGRRRRWHPPATTGPLGTRQRDVP